jgi:hypothetical protein
MVDLGDLPGELILAVWVGSGRELPVDVVGVSSEVDGE